MNNAISLERNFTIKTTVWIRANMSHLWGGVDATMNYVKHEQ